jgi:8-oxo-dGTP diphosphatase
MLTVVAALIGWEGKLLVCQRRRGDRFELLWEFPGGKKKQGETLEEALIRELQEELGITAQIGREIYRTRHKYVEMTEPIELVFFAASAAPAQMQNCVFEQIEWRAPESLGDLDFLPADRELITRLVDGTLRLHQSDSAEDQGLRKH